MAPPKTEVAAYYSFIYPERIKGWVGLVGWPRADDLRYKWSPVSCRSNAGQENCRSKTDVLPLCHATNLNERKRNPVEMCIFWKCFSSTTNSCTSVSLCFTSLRKRCRNLVVYRMSWLVVCRRVQWMKRILLWWRLSTIEWTNTHDELRLWILAINQLIDC